MIDDAKGHKRRYYGSTIPIETEFIGHVSEGTNLLALKVSDFIKYVLGVDIPASTSSNNSDTTSRKSVSSTVTKPIKDPLNNEINIRQALKPLIPPELFDFLNIY